MSAPVLWHVYASSTYNRNDSRSNPSLLRTHTIPRKSPTKRNICLDELVLFQAADKIVDIDSVSKQNSPKNFTFKIAIIACQISIENVTKKPAFLQFTNLLVHIKISMFVCHTMVQLCHFRNGFDMKVTEPLLDLVRLKTLSPIQEIIRATILSELSKLSERSKCSELVATESEIEQDD